jgi:hypothetical protein
LLLPLAAFLVYRLVYFDARRGSVNVENVLAAYQGAPLNELGRRAIELGKDFVETVVFGWTVPAYNLLSSITARQVAVGVALAAAAVVAFLLYARRSRLSADSTVAPAGAPRLPREFVLIGAFTVLAALTPVILTGRDVRWSSGFDRYTLHATLGVGLLVVGLALAGLQPRARLAAFSLLLGLSVATHYANAIVWATFWEEERQFWWQVTWRAPDLKDGTVLLATYPSYRPFEDYEVWGPANLIYKPGQAEPTVASEVIEELTAVKAQLGVREVRSMRVLIGIPRDYNHTLVAAWPSQGSCVHLLDRRQLEVPATASSLVRSLGRYSDLGQIAPAAAPTSPPSRIFGVEPDHGWCWFYQTASLARQRGDWARAAQLADEAAARDLGPRDPTEWMPFFQAYVNLGRLDEARELAARIGAEDLVRHALCDQLAAVYFVSEAASTEGRSLLCGAR